MIILKDSPPSPLQPKQVYDWKKNNHKLDCKARGKEPKGIDKRWKTGFSKMVADVFTERMRAVLRMCVLFIDIWLFIEIGES